MLSFIHPNLQIREFPIQFVIKSKRGLLLIKKKGHQPEGKTFSFSKRCEKIWYMKFKHLLCLQGNYNAQTVNLRNLTPYYTKEGSQNGDGGH